MKYQFVKGEASLIIPVFIRDSSSTTGAGLAGLDQTSSIVGGYLKRNGLGVALAVDQDVTTEGTYQAPTTAAQVRIGTPANMRAGTYELHFHNDLFTTADYVAITLGGATNMEELRIEVQLTTLDLNSAAPDVNVLQISGSAAAANNLETVWDGVEGFFGAYAGPRGPGVYLNDAAANTSTANGVDGTVANPVSTIAAAKTLADSMSLDRIYLVNDSSITLAATMEDYEFVGIGEMSANSINLGSQDVDNSEFWNLLITGAQGGTGRCQATGCALSVITGMEITALSCLIANAGSLTLRNDCAFDSCFSAVAGASTPTLDINSVANVNVYFRHYSGGLTIDNAVATTVMSYEADGQIIIDATCTSLTISVRGNCTITDNGTTTALTQDAAINRSGLVDDIWNEVLTGASHNVADSAARRLRDLQEAGVYEDGAIWIDTVNGSAGTTDFESGTVFNPVNTIADANTLAASLGLSRFRIAPNSSITLAATQANQEFIGNEWTLALGGQSIAGTYFEGASVSGIGTGSNAHFMRCEIGTVTLANCRMGFCRFTATITISAASDYYFHDCYSGVAGMTTPVIDFGAAVANTNLSMRRYSGGLTINNKDGTGTDLMSLEGDGQLIVAASSGGAISIRGDWQVTNTGGATITYDDNTANIVLALADTNELQTDWTDGGRLDLILDIIAQDTTTDIPALIAALNDVSAAEVLTQVNTALDTAISELGVAQPTATPTMRTGLMLLYMAIRNLHKLQTSGTDAWEIYNDAGVKIASGAATDVGGDFAVAKLISG